MSITELLQSFQQKLNNKDCTLVAVSKTKPVQDLEEAYQAGQRHFGENKVQELVGKYEEMSKDIHWHMIGHLQRNKVKYLAPFVYLIHGVDSLRLLKEIDKQGRKNERVIDCLLQVHIAKEESKFGFDEEELTALLADQEFTELEFVRIKGLMGMATFTENEATIRSEFAGLKALFDHIKERFTGKNIQMEVLSMGMTNDYEIAIEEGSTMLRIGSAIFGARN